MKLPEPRGHVSEALFDHLHASPRETRELCVNLDDPQHILADADMQIALWSLYELHYASFDDVDDFWEWDPSLMALRAVLERHFERSLHLAVEEELEHQGPRLRAALESDMGDFGTRFFEMLSRFEGPELSGWIHKSASREQVLEFLINRSIYHLKEADPHTWLVPRIRGSAKSALVELQFDEYGDGRAGRTHAELFATTLREAGLDPDYGAYIEDVGAATLAVNNAMSLFGLHRRLRGAALGHLAAFEATSSLPCRRYAAGLRRTGFSELAAEYFDEHVEADAVHEQLAVRGICAQLIDEEPQLEADVIFGALTCLVLDARVARETLSPGLGVTRARRLHLVEGLKA